MAKTIKQLPKESRETQTPGGQPDVLDIIQGNVLEFATTMSMMNASYYTGKATDGKDLKQAQSKVQANKKSILGDKDSIFQLLDEIKKTITSKETEVLFTAIKHLANNSLAIKNALYINEQPLSDIIDKLVSSNTENTFKFDEAQFGSLKDIIDKLVSPNTENIFKFDEAQFGSLKDIIKDKNTFKFDETQFESLKDIIKEKNTFKFDETQFESLKNIIEDKNIDNIMKKVVDAEKKADTNLKMAQDYYKSFDNTAQKNESNIQKIIDIFKGQTDNNKEELQKLITAFTDSNQNLSNINAEIRKDNESKIVKAKLELMLDGLDPLTIDSLIKFSNINLDKLNENAANLSVFFSSLKGLQGLNIKNVSDKMNDIDHILTALFSQIRIIQAINEFILNKNTNINNFVDIVGNFKLIYQSLSFITNLSKMIDPAKIIEGIEGLNNVLKKMAKLIPMFILVNKAFGGKGINLGKTKNVLDSLKPIFETFNDIQPNVNKYNDVLKSLYIMLPIMENIIPIGIVAGNVKEKNIMQSIHDINEMIFCLFDDINQNMATFNLGDTQQNLEQIKSDIKLIDSILMVLSVLKTDELKSTISSELEFIGGLFANDTEFGLYYLFTKVNEINNVVPDKSKKILESLSSIKTIIDTLNVIKADKTKLQETLQNLSAIFSTADNDSKKSLNVIFANINNLPRFNQNKIAEAVQGLNDIKGIIDLLVLISEQKYNKIEKNFDRFIKVVGKFYNKINDKFEQIIQTGNTSKQVIEANKDINKALNSINETIVKTNSNSANIEKSTIAMEGISEFMLTSTFVMAIGALFIELGGGKFVKDALEFGIVLSIFEGLVLIPAIAFASQQKEATVGIEGLHKLIITSTLIMGIGALFMWLGNGNFAKNALQFGVLLSTFELLVVTPFLIFAVVNTKVLNNVKDLNSVVITCTIMMGIGALFMWLGNGAFVKNALEFGIVLGIFEMLVIMPFILFNKVSDKVYEGIKSFSAFIIVSTTVLLIGAFFMTLSDGELVKNALKFGGLLFVFETLVILPFILFNRVKNDVFDGINSFVGCLTVTTIALLIGAYVMKNKDLVKGAMAFTRLLMIFEVAVIAPFLLFNLIDSEVYDGLKSFSLVILMSTASLIMGAYFVHMQNGKYVENAFVFVGVLAAFIIGVTLPFLLFKRRATQFIQGAREFGVFIAICSFALILGAYTLEFIGKGNILKAAITIGAYAIILGIFVSSMVTIAKEINQIKKDDIQAAIQFSLFVLICSSCLIMGATLFAMGPEYIGGAIAYAIVLGVFVLAMAKVMVYINRSFKAAGGDAKVIAQAITLGGFILLCSISLAIAAFVYDTYKENAIWGALLLVGFVGVMGLLFAGLGALSVVLIPGGLAALAMGVSLLTLSSSLLLVNVLMGNGKDEELKKNIKALDEVIGMLAQTYDDKLGGMTAVWITLGSIAATALGASLLILGGSLAIINKLMGEGKDEQLITNIITLDTIIDQYLRETYIRLGESSGWIALGSIAGIALSASIVILAGALRLIPMLIEPIKDTIIDNITLINNALTNYKNVINTLLDIGGDIALGLIVVVPLGLLTFGLSKAVVAISNSVKKMASVGDISNKTTMISKNISNYIGIIDSIELGGIFGLGKKLAKIAAITAMTIPMSLAILGIATSVQSIASLKIPEEWDANGKPTKFRNITEQDFNLVTININKLLTTTSNAFVYAWDHGLKRIAQDKNGGFWKTMLFAGSISTILSNMTDSVIKIGQALVPDPTSWDPEKGKFTKYERVNFAKASLDAGIMVYMILSMISNAFVHAYNGGPGRPGLKTLFYKDSPFTKAVDAITKMTQTLSGITDSVIKIASAQIPNKWDKDGKIIGYEKINVDDAIKNFRKVLIGNGKTPGMITSMIGAFKIAADKILNNDILSNDEKMNLITSRITSMNEVISKSADLIIKISSLNIPTKFDKDGKGQEFVKLSLADIDTAKTNVVAIIKGLVSLFDTTDETNELNKYLTQEVINPEIINKNIKSIENILPNIVQQIDSLVKFNEQIKNITISNTTDKIKSINNLYDGLFGMINSINSKINGSMFESKNLGTLSIDMGKITSAISTIFNSMGSIYDVFYKNVNKYKNNISNIINQLELSDNGLNVSIKNLKTNLDAIKELYTQEFSDINFDDQTVLDSLSIDLKSFIDNTITPFDNDIFTKATNLHTSIDNIYQSLSRQKDQSKAFKSNTNALQTYIKAINTVDIKKLNSLSSLVNGLNKLAGRLGNLDRLTDVLANELSEALNDLVNSLTEAKETIKEAHELQAERAKQIEQSINRVKSIMNSPLNVNIQTATGDPNQLLTGPEKKEPDKSTGGGSYKGKSDIVDSSKGSHNQHHPTPGSRQGSSQGSSTPK